MQASELMTPHVVTVRDDASVAEAIRLMLDRRISGLPVVDENGALVGIITEGDFLRRVETGTVRHRPRWLEFFADAGKIADEYAHTHGRRVAEVMTHDVVAVPEDAPIGELVELMEAHRIKRLPVMRNGRLLGIVSRANLLHVIAGLAERGAPPETAQDATIRERILGDLAAQAWAPCATVNPVVNNGVVHLHGVIFDERQRQALRVLVENVPGVKSVSDQLIWVEPTIGPVLP